jgi:hypothetical protein
MSMIKYTKKTDIIGRIFRLNHAKRKSQRKLETLKFDTLILKQPETT